MIVTGQLEPKWLIENAAELVAKSGDASVEYQRVPLNTHVSVLFSPTLARKAQAWAAKALKLPEATQLPTRGGLVGGLLGLAGILLLAGPFIREAMGKTEVEEKRAASAPGWTRAILEFTGISAGVVVLLRYGVPLKGMHAFEGDYLASFFLLVGMALLLVHGNLARAQFRTKGAALLGLPLAGLFHISADRMVATDAGGGVADAGEMDPFPFYSWQHFCFCSC